MLGEVGSLDHGDNKQPDATKIWWYIRPQPQFGTLEIRIGDICIDIEDTIVITALIQAIVATLLDLRSNNQSWRTYRQHHTMENKWHAVRYGTQGKLIDFGISEQIDFGLLTQEILSIVNPILDEINIRKEIQHIQQIVKQGTSAKQQTDVYEHALQQDNCNHEIALQKVVDYLAYKTVSGL